MTDTEQPSQWAMELWINAYSALRFQSSEAAALAIHRAFAEREVECLTPTSYALACIANPDWSNMTADDARLLAQKTFAALRSREAGHG